MTDGMAGVIVGLDIGGTKTHIRAELAAGSTVVDTIVPSTTWSASPAADAARWIGQCIAECVRQPVVAVGVGAQGCNTQQHCGALSVALARQIGAPAEVTNDASLLIPAAGLTDGIGVIAGTGSIAVGRLPDGDLSFSGGWGWVLGDEGSAPALVREATRRALADHDAGGDDDVLLSLLATGFGVSGAPQLARAVNDTPTAESWGERAGIVFTAADRGSVGAIAVITSAGAALASLVVTLAARGVPAEHVVVAGSVAVNQTRLLDAFRTSLQRALPAAEMRVLTEPPVAGAITLARRFQSHSGNSTLRDDD